MCSKCTDLENRVGRVGRVEFARVEESSSYIVGRERESLCVLVSALEGEGTSLGMNEMKRMKLADRQ